MSVAASACLNVTSLWNFSAGYLDLESSGSEVSVSRGATLEWTGGTISGAGILDAANGSTVLISGSISGGGGGGGGGATAQGSTIGEGDFKLLTNRTRFIIRGSATVGSSTPGGVDLRSSSSSSAAAAASSASLASTRGATMEVHGLLTFEGSVLWGNGNSSLDAFRRTAKYELSAWPPLETHTGGITAEGCAALCLARSSTTTVEYSVAVAAAGGGCGKLPPPTLRRDFDVGAETSAARERLWPR